MKNETSNIDKVKSIFPAVAALLAGRYDMPELLTAEPIFPRNSRKEIIPDTLRIELGITPRGQIASIVKELDVVLDVATDGRGEGFVARLKLSYNHIDGGSNGKDTDYVVIVDKQWGSKLSVFDVITRQAHYILERQQSERVQAYVKDLTPEARQEWLAKLVSR